MVALQPDQFGHTMANGQMHFAGITPPAEPQPVTFNTERSKLGVREAKRKINASEVEAKEGTRSAARAGSIRHEEGDNDRNPLPPMRIPPRQNLSTNPPHAFEHSVFLQHGRVDMVPVTHLTSGQPTVNQERVDELTRNPKLGSSPRFLPRHELPYGVRTSPDEVKVQNGNHRIISQMQRGALMVPMRVIDSTVAGTSDKIRDTRDQLDEHKFTASLKRSQWRAGPKISDFNSNSTVSFNPDS